MFVLNYQVEIDKKDRMAKEEDNKEIENFSFLDHLEELRWRLIKSIAAIIIIAIGAFIFSDKFIDILLVPSEKLDDKMIIQVLKVEGLFMLKIKVAAAVGIVGSIPVIAYQLWAFVAPGLYENEKKWGKWLVLGATFCFVGGATFAYFVLIPFALRFLITIGKVDIQRQISISYYTQFVLRFLIASGLLFQMPVVSFILTKMGLITAKALRKYWKFAVIIALAMAAFLTPPDPVSMMMMGLPLLLLYEISIIVSRLAGGRKNKT